jgi:hypothetical protein
MVNPINPVEKEKKRSKLETFSSVMDIATGLGSVAMKGMELKKANGMKDPLSLMMNQMKWEE